jgi:hypothetical protein
MNLFNNSLKYNYKFKVGKNNDKQRYIQEILKDIKTLENEIEINLEMDLDTKKKYINNIKRYRRLINR